MAEQRWARHLAAYALGDGERDTTELCGQTAGIEALVTDDYLAFVAATRQGLKVWMLPDLVLELAARGARAIAVAESILTAMQSRYRVGVIEHSRVRLQEIKQHAESCGTCEGGNSAGGGASQGGGRE